MTLTVELHDEARHEQKLVCLAVVPAVGAVLNIDGWPQVVRTDDPEQHRIVCQQQIVTIFVRELV